MNTPELMHEEDDFLGVPLPKIDDLQLAQDLVLAGVISSVDEIYGGESTPEQKARLHEARVRWEADRARNARFNTDDFGELEIPSSQ